MSPSFQTIPCCLEAVPAFLWLEQIADRAELFPEVVVGSYSGLSDQGFQFGERHLYGVQIRRVGRQEYQIIDLGTQHREGLGRLVRGEIVGHDDLSGPEGRGQLTRNVGVETFAIHRAVEHPGCDQTVAAEACDERLSVPVAKGRMIDQTLADRGPAGGLDEIGFQARLIDEDKPFQYVGHVGLVGFGPDTAPFGHVGSQGFTGEQGFLYG